MNEFRYHCECDLPPGNMGQLHPQFVFKDAHFGDRVMPS